MRNDITIRPETQKDYKDIISLVLRSFREGTDYSDGSDIIALIEEIRMSEYYIPELSFVAELDGKIVGHFLFSRFSLSKSKDVSSLATNLKHMVFSVSSSYDFPDSQVSIGGVNVNEVGPFMESKKEKGVYFAGEVLDIDGNCGGYNLSWAFISALLISKHL